MNQGTDTRMAHALQALTADRRVTVTVGILAFILAMTASAYVAVPVPWSVVPMTLQPMVVLLAGIVLGPTAGAASMATYVALGAAGAPVFAGGHAGLPWLVGPTGGYLMAFPVAALVVGWSVGKSTNVVRMLGGLLAGLAVIYLGGVAQLAVLTGQDVAGLLSLGVLPFVGGDLAKVALALVIARAFRSTGLGRA